MMRLPRFRFYAPASLDEACRMLADHGPEAAVLGGGTDLLPNMKRRQQTPGVVISIRRIAELHQNVSGGGRRLGAARSLRDLEEDAALREEYRAAWEAAAQVATPHLRNMGTLGGNLCLDTRCNYYDQNYEWRKAIQFCMKKDGDTCWVAPSSRRCLAVSSTDTAPALMALDARVRLVSASGEREVPLEAFYQNDGIAYTVRRPDEILAEVRLDPKPEWASTYWKLRRRGSFDFPVLSVAAALRRSPDGTVEDARLVLGAVASAPLRAREAEDALRGRRLTDAAIEEAADKAFKLAKPMDNTDFSLHWRKRVAREWVSLALRDLRGDDVRRERLRYLRRELAVV